MSVFGKPTDPPLPQSDAEFDVDSSPWTWWRAQMPVTQKWAYFDHAAVGPLPHLSAEAMRNYATEAEFEGDTLWPRWAKALDRLRDGFATLLGAHPHEVALIPNTSTGISLVAEGFPWKPGDNVIIPDGEFPSNLFPWQNQAHRGVETRIAPRRGSQVLADDLLALADDRTRLIALSWVGFASGFRSALDEIIERAHQRGILVFVDAIQGLGVFDLNVGDIDVDFLAADGHKWLLGPEGLGVMMVRKHHLDLLRCSTVGWNSVSNPFNYSQPSFDLRSTAVRFEPGSPNMAAAAALDASVALFNQVRQRHGPHAIGKRILESVSELDEKLRAVGITADLPEQPDNRSGIVTFSVPGCEPARVRAAALDQQCVVSCRGAGIRAAIHAYNDSSDIDRLVAAIRSSLAH